MAASSVYAPRRMTTHSSSIKPNRLLQNAALASKSIRNTTSSSTSSTTIKMISFESVCVLFMWYFIQGFLKKRSITYQNQKEKVMVWLQSQRLIQKLFLLSSSSTTRKDTIKEESCNKGKNNNCSSWSGWFYRIQDRAQSIISDKDDMCNANDYKESIISDLSATEKEEETKNNQKSRRQQQSVTNPDCNIPKTILSILNYWFAKSPNQSQKSLWMVSAFSTSSRDDSCYQRMLRVDQEIHDLFSDTIFALAQDSSSSFRDEFCNYPYLEWQGKLAAIIALDQMGRHVFRHYKNNEEVIQSPMIKSQKELDTTALQIAETFTSVHKLQIESGQIPINMYIFSLFPYRHSKSLSQVDLVKAKIEEMEVLENEMQDMMRRFRRATTRRLNGLQDEARRVGHPTDNTDGDIKEIKETERDNNDEEKEATFSDEDLLEAFPFDADMSLVSKNTTLQTIQSFLHEQGIQPIQQQQQNESKTTKQKKHVSDSQSISSFTTSTTVTSTTNNNDLITKNKPIPLIVSLSGGVDSMVITHILAHIAPLYNLQIIATHIDYGNRPEAHAEADYCKRFCENHNVLFRCRVISEVTRGITARDEYEAFTRTVRYDFYKEVMREYYNEQQYAEQQDSGIENITITSKTTFSCPVLLGHHKGDLRENVLSNSMKGCGPLELSGMTKIARVENVTIWRPLLPLEKTFILDYAHQYGVPYFKDTTPHWSTRGKLRQILLPLLQDIYGDGCLTNLSVLATESDNAKALLMDSTLTPFFQSVQHYPLGIVFDTKPWRKQKLFFWKFVLKDLLHSIGHGMFSDKSVMSFVERIKQGMDNGTFKHIWLQSRKDYAVYLNSDGRVFVFHPQSFPWAKKDQYKIGEGDQAVNISMNGKSDAVQIGPWSIWAEPVQSTSDDNIATNNKNNNKSSSTAELEKLLSKKAIRDMDHLMGGEFSYYLKCPKFCPTGDSTKNSMLTVVKSFTKQTRPAALKGVDMKIQNTLPFVGISAVASDIMPLDFLFGQSQIVKINFMYEKKKKQKI